MAEFDRLNSPSDWIDLEFVERERTPREIIEVGIQLHVAGVSLSITKQFLEKLGVERHWLYAAVDPETNQFLHVRLFQSRTTERTLLFLRELREKLSVEHTTLLVDAAHHLKDALTRLGLRFQVRRHGNRNSVEHIFREVKRRTSSFSNTFSNAKPTTAESWLKTFAVWWNQC